MMLSVAMIVKNEAKTLERTINSIKKYADEIVVGIDAASTDGSLEIAKRLASKITPIYLTEELEKKGSRDDDPDWGFSKARNLVFNACYKNSWRFVLDGHEIVKNPERIEKIVDVAVENKSDGIELPLYFEPDDSGIPQLIYRQSRIFAPTVRYNNPIHNVPQANKLYSTDDIIVEHRKRDQDIKSKSDRDAQRSEANIEGLKKKAEENPKESRTWFYLATAYKENSKWEEAIKAYEYYLTIGNWKEERWHARINMGTCYSYMGNTEKAREQFTMALEEFPIMAEAYYYLGDLAYKQQLFHEAQVWLEKCCTMELPRCKLFVNPKVYMVNRYDSLSMTYNHLGRYEDAIEQAEKALEAAPSARIEKNIRIWKNIISKTNN